MLDESAMLVTSVCRAVTKVSEETEEADAFPPIPGYCTRYPQGRPDQDPYKITLASQTPKRVS